MNVIMRAKSILCIAAVLVFILGSCKESPTGSEEGRSAGAFAPADGVALFILGQAHVHVMEEYFDEIQSDPAPGGFAFYTSLSGSQTKSDLIPIIAFMKKYPNSALQLAIWTGDSNGPYPGYYLDDIVDGKMDGSIEDLAESLTNINDQPVYIRFGYEFDGSHNAYPPDKYIAAYRYFVDKMRALGADNVAYVWHSWGTDAYYGSDQYPDLYPPQSGRVWQDAWYPGDDYVDWTALSIFALGWFDLEQFMAIQFMLDFTEQHDKPMMLAETAAIKLTDGPEPDWVIPNNDWFRNIFGLIKSNDHVKAFTYINVDWERYDPNTSWGDTRVQAASQTVQSYWKDQVNDLLHADEDLFDKLGFER